MMLMRQDNHPSADDNRAQRPSRRPPQQKRPVCRRESNRRRLVAWLRDEVAVLRVLGFDHGRIAALLDIEEQDVRAFCPKWKEKTRFLSRRAVEALLHGRHASLGGRTLVKRSRRLVEIAAAYTREELLTEPGIGSAAATEIELWLQKRGASLRRSEETSADERKIAKCRLTPRAADNRVVRSPRAEAPDRVRQAPVLRPRHQMDKTCAESPSPNS